MVAQPTGIQLPVDFPEASYNQIAIYVGPSQPRFAIAYRHYAGAWNAVGFRFKAAAEADDGFSASLSANSSVEHRYHQELLLFQFFSNAVAVLDSCAYALHAIGNMLEPLQFLLTGPSLRAADFRRVVKQFRCDFPSEPVSAALKAMDAHAIASELRDIRNILSHRVASTRAYTLSTGPGPDPPAVWNVDHLEPSSGLRALAVDAQITGRYRAWLSQELTALFPHIEAFVKGRL
jgi:hypothetical protein